MFTTFGTPEVARQSRAGLISRPIVNCHEIIYKPPLRIGSSLTLLFTIIHRRILCRYVEIVRRYTGSYGSFAVRKTRFYTRVAYPTAVVRRIERNIHRYIRFFLACLKRKKRPSVMCWFNGDVTTRGVDYRARGAGVQEERYIFIIVVAV